MENDLRRDEARGVEPRVLGPSLGRPVFLGAGRPSFRALVLGPGGRPGPGALGGGFRLVPVRAAGPPLPLDVLSVGPSPAGPDDARLRRDLALRTGDVLYEVALAVRRAPRLAGRRSALFDLVHPDLRPGRHAVVWAGHDWERFVLVFVPDLHLAEAWDGLAADAAGLPDAATRPRDGARDRLVRLFSRQAFAASFVDPNRRWRDFVREANARADRGELDLVVLGGDLVEYRLPANVAYFVDTVTGQGRGGEPLGVPLLTVPGNHDHRGPAYRLRIYPLDRYGLHDLQRDHFFRAARGEGRARPGPRDLRAVLADGRGGSPLRDYLLTVDARPDDVVSLGRTGIVLLDSGRDMFRDLVRVSPRRWGNALRALRRVWLSPASAGLDDGQAALLEREAERSDAANLIVVFHAGLAAEPAGEAARSPMPLGPYLAAQDGPGTRVRLEKALARSGFGRGGLFRNPLSLFRAAARKGRNTLGLSGHFHRPVTLRLDKDSGALSFEPHRDGGIPSDAFARGSFFVGGPAPALFEPRSGPGAAPGFTRVEIAGDRIASVRFEPSPPPERPRLDVRVGRGQGSAAELILSVSPGPDAPAADAVFVVFSRPARGAPGRFPYRVEERTPEGALPAESRWIGRQDRKEFFGRSGPAFIAAFRGGAAGPRRFRFTPAGRPGRKAKAIVAVEVRGENGAGSSIVWHPLSVDLGGRRRR